MMFESAVTEKQNTTLIILPKFCIQPNFGFLFNQTEPIFQKFGFGLTETEIGKEKIGFNRNITKLLPFLTFVFEGLKS